MSMLNLLGDGELLPVFSKAASQKIAVYQASSIRLVSIKKEHFKHYLQGTQASSLHTHTLGLSF